MFDNVTRMFVNWQYISESHQVKWSSCLYKTTCSTIQCLCFRTVVIFHAYKLCKYLVHHCGLLGLGLFMFNASFYNISVYPAIMVGWLIHGV